MASDQTAPVPAGWYPDPYGVSEMRWWDGQNWTDSVHPPEVANPPVAEALVQATVAQVPQDSPPSTPTPLVEPTPPEPVYAATVQSAPPVLAPSVLAPPVLAPPALAPPQPGSLLSSESLGDPPAAVADASQQVPAIPPVQPPAPAEQPPVPLLAPQQPSEPEQPPVPLLAPPPLSEPEQPATVPPQPLVLPDPPESAVDEVSESEGEVPAAPPATRLPSRREMRLRKELSMELPGDESAPEADAAELPVAFPVPSGATVAVPTLAVPTATAPNSAAHFLAPPATSVPDSSTPTAFDWLPGANSRGLNAPPAPPSAPSAFTPPVVSARSHRPVDNTDAEKPPVAVVNAWSRGTTAIADGVVGPRSTATRKATTSGWFIALMPLLAGILSVSVVKGQENYPRYIPAGIEWWMLVGAVIAVLYVVTVLLAIADYRKLDWAGYYRPAHWAWAILTAPVYLLVRTITVKRETGRNSALLWVWLVLVAALVGAWFAAQYFAPELIQGYTLPFL